MTIAIAWVRRIKHCEELVMAEWSISPLAPRLPRVSLSCLSTARRSASKAGTKPAGGGSRARIRAAWRSRLGRTECVP